MGFCTARSPWAGGPPPTTQSPPTLILLRRTKSSPKRGKRQEGLVQVDASYLSNEVHSIPTDPPPPGLWTCALVSIQEQDRIVQQETKKGWGGSSSVRLATFAAPSSLTEVIAVIAAHWSSFAKHL